MIGAEEGRVYHFGSNRPDFILLPDNFPSLSNVYLYFTHFLNAYSDNSLQQGKLKRKLFENIKNNNFLLELKLEDLYNFQNVVAAKVDPTQTQAKLPYYYAEQLVKALTERPLIYLPTIETACYNVCKGQEGLDPDTTIDHIQLNLLNTFCKPTPIRSLLAANQERFLVVPGIVVQAGRIMHKVKTLVLQCRYCDHKMSLQVPVWIDKPAIPQTCRYAATLKALQSTENKQQLGCNGVKDPYVILPNECKFVDVQSLKIQELPEDVPTGDMPRHLEVNMTRYLCEKLIPGDRVHVHGVLTLYNSQKKASTSDVTNRSYLHALGIQKYQNTMDANIEFDLEEVNDLMVLASQPNIHEMIFKSIAPALYGLEHVKKGCACLLFGGTPKKIGNETKIRGDINMLMLGDPSVAKSQILKFVDKVAPVSVYTSGKGSSAAGLTAAVVRDKQGLFSLEGGAMVLADGGVVCIDEFDKMRNDDSVAIHEAMEQQTISISKAGITTMLNSRCSVIAAANPTFGSYNEDCDTIEQHEFKATILSRFDIIFLLRDKEDVERDTILCKHILSLHASKSNYIEQPIPMKKLTRLIQYAKQHVAPILSRDAKDSLRNYYVQKRREYRMDNRTNIKKIPITLRQLESLVRLSERMELSNVATEKHVQMAINLFGVSTAESAKSTLVFESLSLEEQKLVMQVEEDILHILKPGHRATRKGLVKDMQMRGYENSLISKALTILIKKRLLQERGDRSLRRVES